MNKLIPYCFALLLISCKQSDSKKIIGKWQSDDDWFEFVNDSSYNSGKSFITMVKEFKYNINVPQNELTLYTDDEKQTYYLQYQFEGNDTLKLNNILNTTPHFAIFVRSKK